MPTDAERAEALRAAADYLVGISVAASPIPLAAKPVVANVAPDIIEALSIEVARRMGVLPSAKPGKAKRKRKDPKMAKALRQSNARFRKKNGAMRAGATQAKIMSYAHKLRRKM
jgi:hypothetical protein